MAKNKAPVKAPVNEFDGIVNDVLRKSAVTAPSDPNGGAKLPLRQKTQPGRKKKDKTNYMAIFDREAQHSDDQLDDWERATNDLTESPDKFVNDDDDTPEDPDEADEDARGNEEYEVLDDDDPEEGEDDADEDEDLVRVKAHNRRRTVKKSVRGDHADENETLSDDDDDLDEEEEEDDGEDGDSGPEEPVRPSKKRESERKAEKAERRRREVKKALGKDASDMVDASPLVKALVDAVYDLRDDTLSELRQHVSTLRRQNKALAGRIAALEGNVRGDMRSMTKSLTAGVAQMIAPATPDDGSRDPVRKGYGAPVATKPRFPGGQGFNWSRGADILEKALQDGREGVRNTDITLIETDKSPQYLSPAAQQVLREANLIS